MSRSERKISQHTERKAGDYLFSTEDLDVSQSLDMRTRIESEATMRALFFYGTLAEALKSEKAKKLKDLVERLLIARGGKGRLEAVEVLRQAFPKKVEVEKGVEAIVEYPE